MGTEVLPPSDVFIQRLGFFSSSKPKRSSSDCRRFGRKPSKGCNFDRAQRSDNPSSRPSNGHDRIRRDRSSVVIVPKQAVVDEDLAVYAGSGFSQSPLPTSLPMPSFSTRKGGCDGYDQSATRDLRRLLRID